ncbi:MAG TPA: pyridoxal phosphate-dependent aminotransferase [Candidatus Mcinerneyibacteriales bacterium]|nr:pyridoxal phosphate-dependent aminotransferase [Candidatus Mcinerneyibacteriales bacterium]HPJ70185.1 pyridoxal phosphate-dependent aminotransferase [Candidatus Mcinerneyibacteriales bacterium]
MPFSEIVGSLSESPTLKVTQRVNELKAMGVKVLSFGAGEPDFDTPDYIKQAAIEALNNGKTRYTTASGIPELKDAVIRKLEHDNGLKGYTRKNILISSGAKHALWNAVFTILNPDDEAIVFAPYWVSYTEQIKTAEARSVIVPCHAENHFEPRMEDIEASVTAKTRLILLNTPNNPTGAVYTKKFIKELARFCRERSIWVISDEIYEKLIYDSKKHYSIAKYLPEKTIVINGVSKAYAMTGWRIGYVAGPEWIIKKMAMLQGQITSCPNSIAQYASLAAIQGDGSDIEYMRAAFEERRDYMVERLNTIPGIHCKKPSGAFYVFPEIREAVEKMGMRGADELVEYLLEKSSVAAVSGTAFGAEGFLRLSYATSMEEIKEGLDKIESQLK